MDNYSSSPRSLWQKLPYSQKMLSISLSLFVFVLPIAIAANGYSTEFRNKAIIADGPVEVRIDQPEEGIIGRTHSHLSLKLNTHGRPLSELKIAFTLETRSGGFASYSLVPTSHPNMTLIDSEPDSIQTVYGDDINAFILFSETTPHSGFSSTDFIEIAQFQFFPQPFDFDSNIHVTINEANSYAHPTNSTENILAPGLLSRDFPILPNPDRCLLEYETQGSYYTKYCPPQKTSRRIFDEQLQCTIEICEPMTAVTEPNPIDWNINSKFQLKSDNFFFEIDGQKLFVNPSKIYFYVNDTNRTRTTNGVQEKFLYRTIMIDWLENNHFYNWYIGIYKKEGENNWQMDSTELRRYTYAPGRGQNYVIKFENFDPQVLLGENSGTASDITLHSLPNTENHNGYIYFNKLFIDPDPEPTPTPTATIEPTATLIPEITPTTTTAPCTHPSGKKADFNEDGQVNLTDYALLVREFLRDLPVYKADANCDGQVNLTDYAILVREFLR